jgi:hypothetical protein
MLTNAEETLLEAIKTMLQHDAELGLSMHGKENEESGETERGFEYLHNQIDDMFQLKAAELTHANGVCQAFNKVHSYKYVDDPQFRTAMEKEMVAQGIPASDRTKAIGYIDSIMRELKSDRGEWAEKDFGFNPNLDEIMDTNNIEQPLEFETQEVEDWPTKSNVKWEDGDASPGRTP